LRLLGETHINLFDQDTATGYNTTPYRDAINLPNEAFRFRVSGREHRGHPSGSTLPPGQRFLARREIRVMARLIF
jgi:hypothetical protein